MAVTKLEINKYIKKLNMKNKSVLIHASLKSFGKLEDGPKTIADAFLENKCTIIVPTFSYSYEIRCPDIDFLPNQNAYIKYDNKSLKKIFFTTSSKDIHFSMGAFPKYILSLHDNVRGYHPLNSFSGVGPNAKKYIKKQTPTDVYAPIKKLLDDDAVLILMGVDFTKSTAIHLAEQLAGRNLFIRWANDLKGNPIQVRVGSCSDGFYKLENFFKDIETTVLVGNSNWRIFNLREFVYKAKEVIIKNPEITRCGIPGCIRCDDIIKGGPVI